MLLNEASVSSAKDCDAFWLSAVWLNEIWVRNWNFIYQPTKIDFTGLEITLGTRFLEILLWTVSFWFYLLRIRSLCSLTWKAGIFSSRSKRWILSTNSKWVYPPPKIPSATCQVALQKVDAQNPVEFYHPRPCFSVWNPRVSRQWNLVHQLRPRIWNSNANLERCLAIRLKPFYNLPKRALTLFCRNASLHRMGFRFHWMHVCLAARRRFRNSPQIPSQTNPPAQNPLPGIPTT